MQSSATKSTNRVLLIEDDIGLVLNQVLEALASEKGMDAVDINTDIAKHKTLRDEFARAVVAAFVVTPSTREADYGAGWRTAAIWMERDDLLSDMDSPAFKRDREAALAGRAPAAAIPPADVDGKLLAAQTVAEVFGRFHTYDYDDVVNIVATARARDAAVAESTRTALRAAEATLTEMVRDGRAWDCDKRALALVRGELGVTPKPVAEADAFDADTPEAGAYRRVCDEAHALNAGRGLGDLLAAVRAYGEILRQAGAAGARADQDAEGDITQEAWRRAVERVMEAFGDSEEDAREIALELWRAQDHHTGEIAEPLEEALQFLEERPDSPDRVAAKRYRAIRDLPWIVNYDHTGGPDSIEIDIACEGDRAAEPSDSGAELDRIADAAAMDGMTEYDPFLLNNADEVATRLLSLGANTEVGAGIHGPMSGNQAAPGPGGSVQMMIPDSKGELKPLAGTSARSIRR